ncbi:MAG TPA: biotin/lipoyl-containing protein [Candidatus Deferrimicrobiaceae bacterium]|nr:biotin/lipoyl-containing protein [Candidatus Deferrimicrobiaceae bacterium]
MRAGLRKKPAKKIIKAIRESGEIWLTNTGPRDTGQSDFKNRFTLHDLSRLIPVYNESGYFSVEIHGGARFHQNLLNNKIDPFEEAAVWARGMPNVLTQTLIRSTNVWGYRMYPRNVVKLAVKSFVNTIDVWRCFDFLNYVPNMVPVAEEVLKGGKIFEPAVSFTESPECSDPYYLRVVKEIVEMCGGTDGIILCIKDMAGVGSPDRIRRLVDAILQKHPDLVILYHRHSTDGLVIPAMAAAAGAGAKLFDVTDDAFSRFYGHPPVRPLVRYLRELGLSVRLDMEKAGEATDVIRGFIRNYEKYESPYKGFSHDVVSHRMPGGAFPSSFEQAEKGGFLDLMPDILKGMACGNRIIKYFDVTPGSQITWTTWAGIVQRFHKEAGEQGVKRLFHALEKYFQGGERIEALTHAEENLLLRLYAGATDDLKNLLLGRYGPLPFGWPKDWVYRSVFGEDWKERVAAERLESTPLSHLPEENLVRSRKAMEGELGRPPTEEEFVLYLMHPKAAVDYLKFRQSYGDTTVLPTGVWFQGLRRPGDSVSVTLAGKPHEIKLVSIGEGVGGIKQVVLSVDNIMHVFPVELPEAALARKAVRKADPSVKGEIGAFVSGTVWRIGTKDRALKAGDRLKKGEEILNIEVMKTENAVKSPFAGVIREICVKVNDTVEEGQLLAVVAAD